MKAKKSAAKTAKKPAKSSGKKPVKPAPKKAASSPKKPVKAKPKSVSVKAARPATKPKKPAKTSVTKTAASKLKALFSKTKAKPAKSAAIAKQAARKKLPVTQSPKSIKKLPATSSSNRSPLPKGVLSEAQIRRMSDKDYMNDAQLEFFRYRLLQMREEVLERELDVKERLHQREVFADPADRATAEEEHWLDLRLRERESLLLRKIDEALRRIAEKEFGYCEKTGDPIGIPRLLARPTATVCVDVKGQDERVEAQFRDR